MKSMLVSLLKELSLVNLPNKLLRKVLFILLLATSSAAQALTMGDFVVNSFLDKELQAEIVIDGDSGDNLNTLEVSIASEAEFNQAGILRSPLLDQFDFEIVKLSDDKLKILVTTENNVAEPYIHMLLKIRWNGGQLLREFTALIDPPLFSSKPAEPVNTAKTKANKEAELKEELKEVETPKEPVTDAPAAVASEISGEFSQNSYGPVQAGETLSEIAKKIQKSNPDLSIYQIMYVLFQDNQSAFLDKNINNLAKGATLEISDIEKISQVDKQEGVNFFFSQLAQWSANNESSVASEPVDSGSASDSSDTTTSEPSDSNTAADPEEVEENLSNQLSESSPVDSETQPSAEENPEFQVAATDVQSNTQEAGDGSGQAVANLKTKVAELEASVESAKLENEELKETISLLESQLADSARLIDINNQELASLAAENESAKENDPLVATTPTEEADKEQAPEDSATEPTSEKAVAEIEPEGEIPVDEVQTEEASENESPAPVEEQPTTEAPKPAPAEFVAPKAEPSIFESIIDTIKSLWKFLAIGLVGLLAVLYWKVRSNAREEDTIDAFESTFTVYPENTDEIPVDDNASDAKAEELINAIKAESTKVDEVVSNPAAVEEHTSDTSVVSSIDMEALREATQSVNDFDADSPESEITKESSFLTVYNDGDVVVNADEIDPIAEADVYIAYGREDQGEEVLLDGVKNFPDRNDIKIALLGLYAKSGKRTKFDETYASLNEEDLKNNPDQLDAIESLKKTIYGDNDAEKPESTDADNLTFGEDAPNTDFIVNSTDNDLTEIDIKSESFEISEIDFDSDTQDIPLLGEGSEVEVDINDNIVEINNEINPIVGDNPAIGNDEVSIDFEDEIDQIDSITIEVEDEKDSSSADAEINVIADDINEIDLSSNQVGLNKGITSIEQEISQIDFETEITGSEKTLNIDLSDNSASITDGIDISAEISEISYDNEVSLTDVMELNVNEDDLASIPDDQDLTTAKSGVSVSELLNDVDFVDDDDSILNEVTIDLTETVGRYNDVDIDLSLGDESQTENVLPDGANDPETQLDLAKVFLELDDVPGAVKILKELTQNPIVGEEAKELLAKNS